MRSLAGLVEEDPLISAADRYMTLRWFAPELLEALELKAARASDPILGAIELLRGLNKSDGRAVPDGAPMPFRKEWKRLITAEGPPNRRLYETAVFASLRDKLWSGDVWVDRFASYRRFDSYLLPPEQVPPIAREPGLPPTADEWLAGRGAELDTRLTCVVDDLDITRRFGPATRHSGRTALNPMLRFSRAYRFAMPHVFDGGICATLDDVGEVVKNEPAMALPAVDEKVQEPIGRRFLRHERIDAP